jgi:hypothetical protein
MAENVGKGIETLEQDILKLDADGRADWVK